VGTIRCICEVGNTDTHRCHSMSVSNGRTELSEITTGIEPAERTSKRWGELGPLPAGTRPKAEFIKLSELNWLKMDSSCAQLTLCLNRISEFEACNENRRVGVNRKG